MKPIDLTNMRFGRLVVASFSHIGADRYAYWKCLCDCGKIKTVSSANLRRGTAVSCGCFRNERASQRMRDLGKRAAEWKTKHGDYAGGKGSKEYRAWQSMKDRCYRKTDISFSNYGGRGITVCDRWRNSFENFLADMGRAPHGKPREWSVDRINNDGNYEPSNCRWATASEQQKNKKRKTRQ